MTITRLSADEADAKLADLNGWTRDGDSINKTYVLSSFPAALAFVSTVGHLAEAADHHPNILVEYKKVTLTLSTHEADGLTKLDFALAAQVDGLPMRT